MSRVIPAAPGWRVVELRYLDDDWTVYEAVELHIAAWKVVEDGVVTLEPLTTWETDDRVGEVEPSGVVQIIGPGQKPSVPLLEHHHRQTVQRRGQRVAAELREAP